MKTRWPNLANGIKPKKINNKHYFVITGKTHKDLLSRVSQLKEKSRTTVVHKVETAA
jgi:hypothetical protein